MQRHRKNPASRTPAVQLRRVSVSRGDRVILRHVDWTVLAGQAWAVLGPNGAGKSTLVRVITGYLWPTRGEVSVLGEHLGDVDLHHLRRRIGLVNPTALFDLDPRLTARQVVLTGFFGTLGLFDRPSRSQFVRAARLLRDLGLAHLAHESYSVLSSGERMRLLIARALAPRPELLLLDEPTSGLDVLGRESVLASIDRLARSRNAPTVILVTHRLEELPPVVGHVLLLDHGSVVAAGAARDVLRDSLLSRAFGCPVQVSRRHRRWSLHVHPKAWSSLLSHKPNARK